MYVCVCMYVCEKHRVRACVRACVVAAAIVSEKHRAACDDAVVLDAALEAVCVCVCARARVGAQTGQYGRYAGEIEKREKERG